MNSFKIIEKKASYAVCNYCGACFYLPSVNHLEEIKEHTDRCRYNPRYKTCFSCRYYGTINFEKLCSKKPGTILSDDDVLDACPDWDGSKPWLGTKDAELQKR